MSEDTRKPNPEESEVVSPAIPEVETPSQEASRFPQNPNQRGVEAEEIANESDESESVGNPGVTAQHDEGSRSTKNDRGLNDRDSTYSRYQISKPQPDQWGYGV